MKARGLVVGLLLLICPAVAAASVDGGSSAELVPPVPRDMPPIQLPAGSAPLVAPVEIEVVLTIDEHGAVTNAEVTRSGGEALDRAVVEGVRHFRFSPALANGVPVAVRVPFTQKFEPAPVSAAPTMGVLEGSLVTRGERVPIAGANVVATDTADGQSYTATSDREGAFSLTVPGHHRFDVRVVAADHLPFLQQESIETDERVRVKYLVDREGYGEYQSLVRAEGERQDVSRTTLSGRELTHVPGTFADPMRVLVVLPGVSSAMSLLTLPIVRGSSPGTTGFLLDGVRLPLLFHLLAGPSVIHPEFLDSVDFYPGGFPVEYGGYTGGILDAHTRGERSEESHHEVDLNLLQTGVLVREPLPSLGITATVAGRVGYPGLLMRLVTPDVSLSYWDYQARVQGGRGRHRWSLFLYGAHDELGFRESKEAPLTTVASFSFHRLDARYQHGRGDSFQSARLVLGYEDTLAGGDQDRGESAEGNRVWSVNPSLRLHHALASWLDVTTGLESSMRPLQSRGAPPAEGRDNATLRFNERGLFTTSSAFVETVWKLGERVRLIPGVRGDLYDERRGRDDTTALAIDPRFLTRFKLTEREAGAVTLVGMVGRYHQPARLATPLPAIENVSLSHGLLASTQVGLGVHTRIGLATELNVDGYYNAMNPVFMDLVSNGDPKDLQPPSPMGPPPPPPPGAPNADEMGLFTKRRGRSYGLELLLRRRDADRLFGWVSYTLSWSERQRDGAWSPFDFDRRHVLNAVAGLRLPRNWEVGGRLLLQTGTPLTTLAGRNSARSDGQFRFDLRIDKRAVWNDWLLDFYVDVINTTVAPESGGLVGGAPLRYLLPTVGFRGVF